MQVRKFNTATFSALQNFAVTVQTGTFSAIFNEVEAMRQSPLFASKGWQDAIVKFKRMLAGEVPFTIFAKGNSKLPFYAFSTLPGVTCPGAGECLAFCYSFRAWRYPAAFFRQCQNAYLMRFDKGAIASAFDAIVAKNPKGFDFRLYVDGDFASQDDLSFWMRQLSLTPSVQAYGYSKSFSIFVDYVNGGGTVPVNYKLNISSGHNASVDVVNAIRQMPFVRGDFVAVSIGRKVKAKDYGTKPVNDAIRAKFEDKVFPCPGKCGTCTNVGHACGSDVFKGRVIAIAVH